MFNLPTGNWLLAGWVSSVWTAQDLPDFRLGISSFTMKSLQEKMIDYESPLHLKVSTRPLAKSER